MEQNIDNIKYHPQTRRPGTVVYGQCAALLGGSRWGSRVAGVRPAYIVPRQTRLRSIMNEMTALGFCLSAQAANPPRFFASALGACVPSVVRRAREGSLGAAWAETRLLPLLSAATLGERRSFRPSCGRLDGTDCACVLGAGRPSLPPRGAVAGAA